MNSGNWAALDVALAAVAALSVLLGIWRGIVAEVMAIIGWIAAFVLAPLYASTASAWLPSHWAEAARYAGGYAMVFVGCLVLAALVAWAAKWLLKGIGLRPIDRMLGAVFGAARAALIALVLTLLVHLTGWHSRPWWQASQSGPVLDAAVPALKAVLPQAISKHL